MNNRQEIVKLLLSDVEKLLQKKPFTREVENRSSMSSATTGVGGTIRATLPSMKFNVVSQAQFLRELDVHSHDVLKDENIPSVCVKIKGGGYQEIEEKRIALPYQATIRDKHVLHLCANTMLHTLLDESPSQQTVEDFATIKRFWTLRNMEGYKTKMVCAQESVGDAAMLFYHNHKGEIQARVLNYPEYTIISHKDENGEHVLECLYYSSNNHEYIDCYDDKYVYRITNDDSQGALGDDGWVHLAPKPHGFSEIPLVTKRGDVAWNNVQTLIEMFETLYNVFYVIQKRHGWGILYVKGKFKDTSKKIAGSVILNDTSMNEGSDAKFLSAPTPDGTIQTLESLFDEIQIGGGATIVLPKHIRTSGDISGIAIQMTQSRDIETALKGITEWQNAANKMMRLFKEGLAQELVEKGIDNTAITRFENIYINSSFRMWRPFSESEFNQMLATLKGAGLLSIKSGTELNTVAAPDEFNRVLNEKEDFFNIELEQSRRTKEMESDFDNSNTNTTATTTVESDVEEGK